MFNTNNERETVFSRGFPVGFHTGLTKKSSKHYLYNHIRIIIQYHDDKGAENPGGEATTTKVRDAMYLPLLSRSYLNGNAKFLFIFRQISWAK